MASYYPETLQLNRLFAIKPAHIVSDLNQSWWHFFRLGTALFLHGNWQHWVGNMLLFLIIAVPLEKRVGGFWFLVIFFITGFAGNILSIYQLNASTHYLLGASGAVSGLLGAWLLLFPQQKISIIIPIGFYMQKAKIPVLLLAFIWLAIQVILQFSSNHNYPIVWSSHIVGFIVGFLMAWLYRASS